ncbi:beta/gamma crystallin domain-containing protein 2 [Ochotona princeps]|uniref:beta/gamma crystallin domain-containing protein 2 n=1 Tax=Ochotona princeps TaxID=9978 RepID=UPI0027151E4C|nr:beta/gamma crystallin domain-containing protein 2 [Ochotona princeps]
MEEAGGSPAQTETRVVSATLTWWQRSPGQEEIRHRFHKVSLVSGASRNAPQEELLAYSHRREEVNGFATRDEESSSEPGPREAAGSRNFQSHGPIFSRKYIPPPKEKRPSGRSQEAVDQNDSSPPTSRPESSSSGTTARNVELLVPLPGPREPSPHPTGGLSNGSSRNLRVMRTVRATTVVGGSVDRRVSSTVTVGPSLSAETLQRGRHVARAFRTVVVNPTPEGGPSRSQALELLNTLMPVSRLPRPTAAAPKSPGLGGTGRRGSPATAPSPQNQDVPIVQLGPEQGRAPDAETHECLTVLGTSSPTQLPVQASGHIPVPSSPRLQTQSPSSSLVHSPEQPVVPTQPGVQLSPHALPPMNTEVSTDAPVAAVPPTVRSEIIIIPGQHLAPSLAGSKAVPSPGCPSPSSPIAPDATEVPSPSLPQESQDATEVPSPSLPRESQDATEVPSFTLSQESQDTAEVPSPSLPRESQDATEVPSLTLSQESQDTVEVPSPSLPRESQDATEVPSLTLSQESQDTAEVPSPSLPWESQDATEVPSLTLPPEQQVAQGPGTPADPAPSQKEMLQDVPDTSSPKPSKVVGGPSGQEESVQDVAGSPASSLTKEETEVDPAASTTPRPQQDKAGLGSEGSPLPSPTAKEVVQDSGVSAAPFPTHTEAVQDPVAPLAPSSSVDKVTPSPGDTPGPVPVEAEVSVESQPVPDSIDGKPPLELLREEEELALAADLEIFLDTLRSMEPPEILRTHRLPRAPRASYLAMYATLPAIEEDQPGPWVLAPSPQQVPVLEKDQQEEAKEEEEEPENPYLSDDEKLQLKQEKAKPGPSWDLRPSRPSQGSCSPLEMMKKHVAGAKGPQPELGPEAQANSRRTSRLGGSLLFGNLMPAAKETTTPEPLGTKLSALPPHEAPGVRKVLGQLPLLCSESLSAEKTSPTQDPQGWSPALKTQGKLNTRPGKVILFSEPSCQGDSTEVWEDIADASGWAPVASIRVIRGCWVLYEEPEFRGRKLVLPEGDMELRGPEPAWSTHGIGSLRRVVQDYRTPEISLFSEEGFKGEQVKLTEALKDTQGLEQPLQVASATVSAGLWLLYPKPFFEDTPYVLEPGEYPTLEAWGASDPGVGSLKPVRLGCPSVERPEEPKAVVYEAPGFQGRSWEVSRDIYNLQQPEDDQSPQLASVGSLRILGGCWVGYEKEGFRGHQYLLEEGEYADWSHWGGYDALLTSLRVIRTDFGDPAVVLFEAMDFQGHGVEVSTALPDVELKRHGPRTQAIHVLSGVWVAYEAVGFSGEQYVLEKGVYRNCNDWGAGNSALASLQPVLQVGEHDLHFVSKIQLFSSPGFLGDHISLEEDQTSLPASFQPQSCRVHGGSWILFDEKDFQGDQHVLSEGEFPTLTAMGCLSSTVLGSLRKVPLHFSEPSIFLYGLECFEGKEIELNREVRSLQAEGFNDHVLSVRIRGGVWVLCEHSDFRGHQWLVGSCEITNWLTYSGTQRVGSLYPIKQRRAYFRLWNAALGGFLAVPDHVEDMKAGRVVVSNSRTGGSCVWYYEDGLLKNQVAPTMSLQVIGTPSPGSKVVLWSESRMPRQTWSISDGGHICSQMFEGRVLDVKGGRGYDRDHVVLWEPTKERTSQTWTLHIL